MDPSSDTQDVLEIESIIAGGDGIARRADGCVVFVPRVAPGERVRVAYTDVRPQWRRARVVEVLEPSGERREAPCPHYDRCGGCQLQHLSYGAQLDVKSRIVEESLRRLGGVAAPAPAVTPSGKELGYRNRVSLVLRQDGPSLTAGYHDAYRPSTVIDIDHCPLAEPVINDVWSAVRREWASQAKRMPRGPELRLTLRATANGAMGLAVEGAREPGEPNRLIEAIEALQSVWLVDPAGRIQLSAGRRVLEEEWAGYTVALAGNAFLQVNRQVALDLDKTVRERCGDVAGKRIVDAYCGFGLRALDLARQGASVVGIDYDAHAVRFASQLTREHGVAARFIRGRVEDRLGRELPADIVIMNPPRRGVVHRVIDLLLKSTPALIIYVSCDPPTLARDVKGLSPAYDVDRCESFDLFPQTAHVETVAVLRRRPGPV